MASRDYPKNGYPSVTSILGVLRKIGLEMWYKFNTAAFCDEKSSKGKLIGTQIHDAIEQFIKTGEAKIDTDYPDEVTNALKSFMLFKAEHPEYTFKFTEEAMTSEQHKLNGTLDCIVEKDGLLIVADWKSAEAKKKDKPDIYEEYLYQVSAYVKMYNEVKKSNINQAFIVSFAKDKIAYNYQLLSAEEIEKHFNDAFLPALKIYQHQQWLKNQKKENKNGLQK
jgi:hypothetical protein